MKLWIVEYWGDHEIGGTDSVWSTREQAVQRAKEQNELPQNHGFSGSSYGVVCAELNSTAWPEDVR